MGKKKKKQKKIVEIYIHQFDMNEVYVLNNKGNHSTLDKDKKSEILTENVFIKKDNKLSDVLYFLTALFCPFWCNRMFNLKDDVYVQSLAFVVSVVLQFTGMAAWIMGIGSSVYLFTKAEGFNEILTSIVIILGFFFLASILIFSGQAFEREKDSDKIYQFSSCIIAIISCIISFISIIKG